MPVANLTDMSRCLICLFVTLLCAASTLADDKPVDANRQRAEMLWEEAIQAKGGRTRLHSIESFVISSTIDVNAPSKRVDVMTEHLYVMPGKAWIWEYTPAYDVSLEGTVINMDRDFCRVTLWPVGPMHSVPSLSFCVPTILPQRLIKDPVIYLMETKWVRPTPVSTRIEGKGKKQQDVVQTQVGQLWVDFYLDRKTHLPTKLITDENYGEPGLPTRMDQMITFEDYTDVDGIQMPRRVIREPLRISFVRRDTERAKYSFNVTYKEEIFNFPVTKKAKAGDWKQ